MNLIFLGPPGAGKGTQAQSICSQYKIPQISTGDMLREAKRAKTDFGNKVRSYMLSGQLVPDELVLGIVNKRLLQADCDKGFILDGFPRTVIQADALLNLMDGKNKKIEAVLRLKVPDEFVVKRLSGRRVCGVCSTSYHLEYAPSAKLNLCDCCGGDLLQRKDDSEEIVKERLKVYRMQTEPLISYYTKNGILKSIDGTASIDEIKGTIQAILKALE